MFSRLDSGLTSLDFTFEANRAHRVEAIDQILLAVDRAQVKRVSERELPDLETLETLQGGNFRYRYRVPLVGDLSQSQPNMIRAAVPVGVLVTVVEP